MNQHEKIYLVNFKTEQNADTGERVTVIDNLKSYIAIKDIVGIQTQAVVQARNIKANYSFEIMRIYYNDEMYLGCKEQLYEIQNISKAKNPNNLLLVVSVCKDAEKINAYLGWRNENL